MPAEYTLRRRVQFAETDAAGIVHFAMFFRYMEEAEHALWREAGLSIVPADPGIGFPRVAASFEFHTPLRFEEEFDVRVAVASINRRTIEYTCLITRNGRKVATGTMRIACVRKRPGEPLQTADIPAEIVERLSGSARTNPS